MIITRFMNVLRIISKILGGLIMEPEERVKTAAISLASDLKVKTFGGAEKHSGTSIRCFNWRHKR
jgi:hypothetical protein